MKNNLQENQNQEKGFVLVTSIILLAILMVLGTVSLMKSNFEIKISAGSMQAEQAYAAMNAGLNEIFAYWKYNVTGKAEFTSLTDWVGRKAGSAPSIYVNSYPAKVSDTGGNPPAGARIYTLAVNGSVSTGAAWGSGNDPQVAVWATSFTQVSGATDYPYATPTHVTGSSCSKCAIVVYALGRSGNALRLGREYMSTTVRNIKAYGAMMNAPQYKTLTGRCDSNPAAGSNWSSSTTSGGSVYTHMIDSTQAPGGVAMASNNGVNVASGSKPFPNNTGSSLKGIDPYVVYDPGKVNKTNYPKIAGDKMTAISATVVRDNLFGTADEMNFFNGADTQLFNLDAYREAANRIAGFVNEDIYGQVVNTGGTTLGNYTTLKTNNAGHARMGTIQWADFVYNVNNQVPMYGLVRIMIPMNSPSNQSCGTGTKTVKKFRISNDPMPVGRLIVYGAALFDFFWDKDGDDLYEPNLSGNAKERLLTPTEALISNKLNVDTHIAFNPVMDANTPRSGSGKTMTGVGVPGILEINTYPDGSPSWDLASDALPGSDGAMDTLMNIWDVGNNWITQVHDNGANYKFSGYSNGSWALTADQKTLLDYYIRTTSEASKPVWSARTVQAIEANPAAFKIQTDADTKDSNSAADLFHSFLPSGYVHGWKRAMAVTGLAADPSGGTTNDNETIWSEDLLPVGSQFHDDRHDYFFVTKKHATGKVYIDKDFADLPAEMYAGGLVDMHQHSNTSGVVYTPDQLELELKGPGGVKVANAMQYINGLVITGAGVFMKDDTGGVGRAIIAYDDTSIDNLPVNKPTTTVGRKYWQELK